eukprot:COSAG05_NODE_17421_length_325_cov_0.991150_1_plen_50_part_10
MKQNHHMKQSNLSRQRSCWLWIVRKTRSQRRPRSPQFWVRLLLLQHQSLN